MANRDKIERLEDLIKDSIGGELVEQKVTSLLPPGENYGSVMYKVDFKVKKDGKEKEYHAVAKCTPLNQVTQELFNTQETFKSEIAWYTTVIPTLKKFAKDHGLKRELDFFQEFYGARISLDPNSEKVDLDGVILTENLKYLGFKTADRHIGFDLTTTRAILRDLATFHAVPMALRHYDLEKFEKKIRPYLPTWEFSCHVESDITKSIFPVYEYLPEFEHLKGRIAKMVDDSDIFKQREVREPWITGLHMDFWTNNVMITEEVNPKTIILDLQCPGYGSPAADVAFFLLTSVKTDVIDNKLDELFQFYHKELTDNLMQLKVPLDKYSFEDFNKEIDIEVKGGELAHVLSHLTFTLGEKGVSAFDATDDNFKYEDFTSAPTVVNDRQISRFRWVTKEAEDRRWV